MNAIQSIELNDFQSHLNSKLEFSTGLNVIIGPSDSGKTATIRALKWLLYNEPSGYAFIRSGAKTAEVTMITGTGTQIIRERGKQGGGRYTIIDPNQEQQIYEGFGTGVPLEVTQIHGMHKAEIGDWKQSLNISYQLDPAFLLHESAGVAAKVLGKLAGTEVVDLANKTVHGDLFKARQERNQLCKLINETEEQLQQYEYLPNLLKSIQKLTTLYEEVKAATEKKAKLEELKLRYNATVKAKETLDNHVARLSQVIDAEPIIYNLELSINRVNSLSKFVSHLNTIKLEQEIYQKIIDKTTDLELGETSLKSAESEVRKTESLHLIKIKHNAVEIELKQILTRIKDLRYLNQATQVIDSLELSINKAQKLTAYGQAFKNTKISINNETLKLSKCANIDQVEAILNSIPTSLTTLQNLNAKSLHFEANNRLYQSTRKQIEDIEHSITDLANEYATVLRDTGKCPTCMADITADRLDSIIQEVI